MTEEQKIKCEEVINSSEEKYKKEFEEINTLNTLGFGIYGEDSNPIPRMFDEDLELLVERFIMSISAPSVNFRHSNTFLRLLAKANNIAGENIIDLTVSLSEVFNKNMDKEEAEKFLFVKSNIEEELIETYGLPPYHYYATGEFGNIKALYDDLHKNSEDIFKYKYNTTIENIGWAIANYFDNNKENDNNQNEEKNKNFNNNENKINNVVENTAKEKIMQPKEQRKQCEEIINSYKTKLGNFNFIVPNNVSKISPNITLFTIPEYMSIIKSITISLAKVFNKDITEKETEKIILDLKEDLIENPNSEKYKDFESMCWSIVEKLDDELKLNLLILGKTGVGKSSLLNALVGKDVAKVSDAEPETDDIYPYPAEIDGKKITIYDSWGMEVGKEKIWNDIVNSKLKERGIDKPIEKWFHSVTYCIQAGGNRIEDFDAKIITEFIKGGYKVIVALTKAELMAREDREKFIEKIKGRIKKEIEKEGTDNYININDIIVISVSASPKKLDNMTEAPKPFGLAEYKSAILVSWKNIFIDRIPLHIIEKLKKDIEKAKYNAPREGNNLKKLAKEIQEYFINVLKEKLQIYMKENFKKYYKITEDILTVSKNIDISDLNLISNMDNPDYIFNVFNFDSSIFETIGKGFILLFAPILGVLIGAIQLIYFYATKSEKINDYINEISQTMIDKIGEKEFESEIRKIIIETLNEIDKKIIKLN